MPRHAQILGQIADELSPPPVSCRKAEQLGLARRLANDAKQRLDEGRLARPVAAEQAKNLPPLDAQRDPLQGLLPLAAD
jgi:hypothetical protein